MTWQKCFGVTSSILLKVSKRSGEVRYPKIVRTGPANRINIALAAFNVGVFAEHILERGVRR